MVHRGNKTTLSYRDAVSSIKVAITVENFPMAELTVENFKMIKETILKEVDNIPKDGPKVSFVGCSYKTGFMVINCVNETSKNWLTGKISVLEPWEGARLKWMEGDNIPKPNIFLLWIPGDGTTSQENILHRLERQNERLETNCWKVIFTKQESKGQLLTIYIDPRSEEVLKANDFKAYYNFDTVVFRKKNRPAESTDVESTIDVEAEPKTHNPDRTGVAKRVKLQRQMESTDSPGSSSVLSGKMGSTPVATPNVGENPTQLAGCSAMQPKM